MALLIALLLAATDAERRVRGCSLPVGGRQDRVMAGWWASQIQAPQCPCHGGALPRGFSCLTPLGVVLGGCKISNDRRSITAGGGTVTVMAQTQRLAHLGHHGWAPL